MDGDEMAQNGTGVGNTKKQRPRYRHLCFTLNNPDDHGFKDYGTMAQILQSEGATLAVYQLEVGEQGTPHLQGVVSFKNPKDFSVLKKLHNAIHWEQCHNLKASIVYCSKKEGRIAGPWSFGVSLPEELKIIKELRPFQQQIIDIIGVPPDDRSIHWFWEESGNIGKTALAKYICSNYKALFLSGKANDIKSAIVSYSKSNGAPEICIFHFVRTMAEYISYQAIEEVKDGIFFNGKYESGMFMMNSPHVIVLANFPPEEQALSADRWNITRL